MATTTRRMNPTRWPVLIAAALVAAFASHASDAGAQPADSSTGDDSAPNAGDTNAGGTNAGGTRTPTGSAGSKGNTNIPAASAPGLSDLEALRQEYLQLRDRLFRSRARAAAVASALYSSKIQVRLVYGSARFYSVERAMIRLDGANVFDDSQGAIATDKAPRFEGYVAPGRHQLTIRIEATGKDDQRFTSTIENTFAVQAPAGHDLIVVATARDGGDIPYSWNKRQRGSYKLHLDVGVEAKKQRDSRGKKAKKSASTSGQKTRRGEGSRTSIPRGTTQHQRSAKIASKTRN